MKDFLIGTVLLIFIAMMGVGIYHELNPTPTATEVASSPEPEVAQNEPRDELGLVIKPEPERKSTSDELGLIIKETLNDKTKATLKEIKARAGFAPYTSWEAALSWNPMVSQVDMYNLDDVHLVAIVHYVGQTYVKSYNVVLTDHGTKFLMTVRTDPQADALKFLMSLGN
jgi:hypothetical protein